MFAITWTPSLSRESDSRNRPDSEFSNQRIVFEQAICEFATFAEQISGYFSVAKWHS